MPCALYTRPRCGFLKPMFVSSTMFATCITLSIIFDSFFIKLYNIVIFCNACQRVRCIVTKFAPLTESSVAVRLSVGWVVGVTSSHCHYPCVYHFLVHLQSRRLVFPLSCIRSLRWCGCNSQRHSDCVSRCCRACHGCGIVRISSCSSSYTIIFGSTPA